MLTPIYKNIPLELQDRPQWVVWRLENREGKPTKVPFNPKRPQAGAMSNNPKTWGAFALAQRISKMNGFKGPGYMFSKDDPYSGIDLDKCRDPETSEIAAWAWKEIKRLNSYTEVSPSATGVKIWVKGILPLSGRKKGNYEMYSDTRFFTMTGHHLEGTPTTIEDRQVELTALHREVFGEAPDPQATSARPRPELSFSDSQVIERARGAKNGDKFSRLMRGDISGQKSGSEADLALCSILAFWTQDREQINRIFQTSGLYRNPGREKKWNRPTAGSTYGMKTIDKAINDTTETYQGPGFNKDNGRRTRPAGSAKVEEDPKPQAKRAPVNTFNLTDMGNAQRIVAKHGQDIRYCYPWGKWLVWDEARWKKDDTGEVDRRAKATVQSIYTEAGREKDKDRRKGIAQFAMRCESELKRKAMIASAMSEPGIPILPDEMDRDPWLLNVLNGTIDLKVRELRPHRKGDLITKLAPVKYDPAATCSTWEKFLKRIMADNQNLIGFLQRSVGYALTGDTREQCLFFLWGLGANGKSTFLEVIHALMGDYAKRTSSETFLAKKPGQIPNDIAALKGARFVAAVEIESGRRMAEVLIKQMTGGDKIAARFLHAEFFEYDPEFKIFLAANHEPVIRGTDNAIWRRIHKIPFAVQIPIEEQDRELPHRLREELPGILNWALAGCLQWRYGGLGVPEEVKQATQDYRADMDVLGDFISEHCTVAPGASAPSKDLYKTYRDWAEDIKEKNPLSQTKFGLALTERGFEVKRTTGGAKLRKGIALKN
ncbi:MAG: phage/plasmid primase, P4 family [Desulfobacterales bacterium]|nr:DNA primase [Pseudomonadota bacterium]MCG2772492.1 phage/plasmid primase, P4 family [Desulfobacterales bacterium]